MEKHKLPKLNNFFNRRGVNIDITHRCALECPRCPRQYEFRDKNLRVPGNDMSIEDFTKVAKFMNYIDFEGQYSDPVHHPKFIDFLKICLENKIATEIHNASSVKSLQWYTTAFKANPFAKWVFSIDGLPEESHLYRINQDGKKLFEAMKLAVNYLKVKPVWQYIVFSYNENSIDAAIELAADIDVDFYLLQSSRWADNNDPLMPSEKYRMSKK